MNTAKILADRQLINTGQKTQAEAYAKANNISLADAVVQLNFAPKQDVFNALAQSAGVPFVEISFYAITPECLKLISQDTAHKYSAIPLFDIQGTLTVAMEDPGNLKAIDKIRHESKREIEPCLASSQDIMEALANYYGASGSITKLIASLDAETGKILQNQFAETEASAISAAPADQPIVKLVNLIIEQAINDGASDVHIEPDENELRIRYRIDGVLHEVPAPSKSYESSIISRIKVQSNLNIAETRIAQDGRMKVNAKGRSIDIRVSIIPTIHGENVVLRLLDTNKTLLDLKQLGFSDVTRKRFEDVIKRPYGMVLEAGPTGSGKTTTLYAALSTINSVGRNIVTIEDPVEYKLPLIRQIQVNAKANLTFATGLRSIVRQDPDVIMVGEIRDAETASIAVQAASTGHLVFSTLHTNNAVGAVSRLVEMGVEPFLIASSLIGVLAQRLVRRICEQCKEIDPAPDESSLAQLANDNRIEIGKLKNSVKFYKGRGCQRCRKTGYRGRVGIFELLKISEKIQELIVNKAPISSLVKIAREEEMETLSEDGFHKIKLGFTTVAEVVRAV